MTSRSCQLWPLKLCTAIKSLTFNNIKSGQNKNLEKIPDFRWFLNQWHRQFGRKNPSTSNSSRTYDLLVTCPELYHWATGVGDLWELRPLNYCRFMWQTSCIHVLLGLRNVDVCLHAMIDWMWWCWFKDVYSFNDTGGSEELIRVLV